MQKKTTKKQGQSRPPTTENKYSCGQINLARSPTAWEELKIYLEEQETDILLICEPPIRLQQNKQPPFGYVWHYQQNEDESGAGILIRKNIPQKLSRHQDTRSTTVEITSGTTRIRINSFYLQPKTLKGIQAWETAIKEAKKDNVPLITGGDVNAHSSWWGPTENNTEGDTVEDLILDAELCVINDADSAPTFQRRQSSEQWLDITVTSPAIEDKVTRWRVEPDAIPSSDHNLITYEFHAPRVEYPAKETWNWKRTSWKEFKEVLAIFLPDDDKPAPQSPAEIDDNVTTITMAIQAAMRLCVPKTRPGPHSKEWFDEEAKACYTTLKHKPKQSPDYMKAKEEWRRLIRTKKTQAFQRFVEQTDKNNCWEALRRLEGKRKRTEITRLKTGEQYRTDPEQIAAALAKRYFPEEEADRTQEDPQSPRIHVTQGTTKTSGNNKPKPTEQFTSKTQITFELARRRAKTTPGHDEIPFMVLRQNADKLAGPLAKLHNAIAKIGYYPTSWRKGIVCNI